MNQPLSVQDLVVEKLQPGGALTVVGPLSITVSRGEILGLVGESGSGKTLTLRALAGIPPTGLTARTPDGPYAPTCRTAIVFQDPMGFFNPRWKIRRSISEVLRVVRRVPRKIVVTHLHALLDAVGLTVADGSLYPFEMSGGMIQRAAIAIALATEPEVLLADEATSALDPLTRDRILQLLCRVGRERQVATIVVSHDLVGLGNVADRVTVLYEGIAIDEGRPATVLGSPRHRYTDLLVRSLPGRETRGTLLPEMLSKLSSPATGCPFFPRCPAGRSLCERETPPWTIEIDHRYKCHFPAGGGADQ
jgi:peptide/nickel transport system ATP-binding protein